MHLSLTLDDYRKHLKSFTMSPDDPNSTHEPYNRWIMHPNLQTVTKGKPLGACAAIVQELAQTVVPKKPLRFDVGRQNSTCRAIDQSLHQKVMHLSLRDILTALVDRWFNSYVINAYIHALLEAHPMKHFIYVNSAEDDPTLEEIAATPACFPIVISPLFRDHHWTMLGIFHNTKEIFYLNSDVVDQRTPKEQTRPFQQLFPGYKLHIIPCVKQCDNSSCGAYVCFWAYAFLYRRDALLNITCPDILRFRTIIRQQLLFSYFIQPRLCL